MQKLYYLELYCFELLLGYLGRYETPFLKTILALKGCFLAGIFWHIVKLSVQ